MYKTMSQNFTIYAHKKALFKAFYYSISTWSLLLFSTSASAQISVNDVIVQFKAGDRPVQNVVVKNSSPDVFYVTASCDELSEPSEEKSSLVPTEDIIVSPKRFSIEGNSERVVRLLHRKPTENLERVYRIAFVPQDKNFGDTVEKDESGRKTVLKVLTGMGLLVFADPVNPKPELKWERKGNTLKFYNTGNQHVRVFDGKACKSEGVDCVELVSRRVYGGKEFVQTVDPTNTVYYTRRDGASGDFKSIVIPPNS
jgi:P pilus assembly chaperone PapD